MAEMETVKTFDAYFYGNGGTSLYTCSVWARSEEHMKEMLREKFPNERMKNLAFCDTHGFLNDQVESKQSPVPMLLVYKIDLTDIDNIKAEHFNFNEKDFTKQQ